MKKLLVFLCAVALIFSITATANALILYGDGERPAWEAAVGDFVETSDYPGIPISTFSAGTGIDVGYGETLAFDIDLSLRKIGIGWATWSGGYDGEVLFVDTDPDGDGIYSVSATFTPGYLTGFGFEAEPNLFQIFDIELALDDGSSWSQAVYGLSGAKFFGWTGYGVTSMTISSEEDFAFGRFVAAVPEPSTMLLLGSCLIGIGFFGRKKLFKK